MSSRDQNIGKQVLHNQNDLLGIEEIEYEKTLKEL